MMTNDIRQTISSGADFYPMVKRLFEEKQQVAVLYEDNGVTRAHGNITVLYEKDGVQWMELDDHTTIRIDQLYAVNGIFTSDYSEC